MLNIKLKLSGSYEIKIMELYATPTAKKVYGKVLVKWGSKLVTFQVDNYDNNDILECYNGHYFTTGNEAKQDYQNR